MGRKEKGGVSLHGFALNVNLDLSFFEMIRPCGLKGVKATSIVALLKKSISLGEIKESAIVHFREVFNISIQRMEISDLFIQISYSGPSNQLSVRA